MKRTLLLTTILTVAAAATGYAASTSGLAAGAVPEPMSLLLIGTSLMGLGLVGRRKTEE
jgi:hypothetical protein